MESDAHAPVRRRRHGQALETAILTACWDELVAVGYSGLTMASVASRAQTSEPVIYRRWTNKDQFVLAALRHYRNGNPIAIPDTGALRDDLIAELAAISESFAHFYAIAWAAAFSGLLANSNMTPAQVRDTIVEDQPVPRVRTIFRRAHARGELDLEQFSDAVLAVPYDLVRLDLLMDVNPLKLTRIREIVDQIFLPLISHHAAISPRNTHADEQQEP